LPAVGHRLWGTEIAQLRVHRRSSGSERFMTSGSLSKKNYAGTPGSQSLTKTLLEGN
jgi:hypothetical protein